MADVKGWRRREVLNLGAGAAAGLAIAPEAIAQAAKGGPLRPVTVGTPAGNTGATLIEVMRQQGFFEEYGLAPRILSVTDGSKIVTAVLSGEVDICRASGFGQVLTIIEKGGALKVVCGASVLITQAMFTAKPEIKTLKDLEGRTVGSGQPGALLHNMTVTLLRKKGVDPDKMKFVNIGSSADVFRAVVAGTVDAGPSQIDVYEDQARFGVHSIADFWTELPEYPYQAGYTSDRTLARKRDVIVSSLAAFGRLYAFIQSPDSMDAYVSAYVKATGGKPADAEGQWQFLNRYKPYDLMLGEDKIEFLQGLNLEAGIQKKRMPLEKIADFSMVREALKLLA